MRIQRLSSLAILVLVLFGGVVCAYAQKYSVLYNFGSRTGDPTGPHYSGVITQGRDGAMYSTADNHWTDELGAAFRMTRAGSLTVLHRFRGPDGKAPNGGVTIATGGNYYGTTDSGGLYSLGTIFRVSDKGTFATLYNFKAKGDGSHPQAPPIQGYDGNFYGTTIGGSKNGELGTVYKITSTGVFTVLHNFSNGGGAQPFAPLVQGTDGNFYGTTFSGGSHDQGTIFRITRSGALTVLFNFDGLHGGHPYAPMIQASDGYFYGVTTTGGSSEGGVAFRITSSGVLRVLHNFTGGMDGSNQVGGLVQATDGNFYGTNNVGGASDWGVLFRMTPSGTLTVLHAFAWETGASPQAALLQHTSGVLFSTTAVGGVDNSGEGTFYSFDVGLRPFVRFVKAAGHVGDMIGIIGQDFYKATKVSFNGAPGTFTVHSNTYLQVTVPTNASTGFVTVSTPTATIRSDKKFLVLR